MSQEIDTLRKDRLMQQAQLEAMRKESQQHRDEVDQIVDDIQKDARRRSEGPFGTTKLVIAGDAGVGFTATQKENSTFSAGFAPLFLWQFNDRLLFEAGLDIGIDRDDGGNNETTVDLTLADASYLVNDYVAIGGGLFVVPFGIYHLRYDPPWIDKLPDEPLVYGDNGLAPGSEVGVFATGAIPVGSTKLKYAVYATNGPSLVTSGDTAGSLDFSNYTDLNNDKAIGGHIGWQIIPQFEVGYSIMRASVNPEEFHDTSALLQGVDVAYRREVDAIKGTLDLRAEWVFSHVNNAMYDTGSGPFSFHNDRDGGYVQLAYRPDQFSNEVLKKLEFIARYDRLQTPDDAPGGDTEDRWTVGVDYWLAPNAVLKAAYEFDHKKMGDGQNAFLMQFGIGL
jgi:hypothetical protein